MHCCCSTFNGISSIATSRHPLSTKQGSEDAWESGLGYSIFKKMPVLEGASPQNPHTLLHFLSCLTTLGSTPLANIVINH